MTNDRAACGTGRRDLSAAQAVLAWVRLYTAAMPPELAARRLEELASDVRDHIDDALAGGAAPRQVSRSLVGRMVRGAAGDLTWRVEVEARLTGRTTLLARPGALVTAMGALSLPFWLVAEIARRTPGSPHVVHAATWAMACTLWAVCMGYAVVAVVYLIADGRHRR